MHRWCRSRPRARVQTSPVLFRKGPLCSVDSIPLGFSATAEHLPASNAPCQSPESEIVRAGEHSRGGPAGTRRPSTARDLSDGSLIGAAQTHGSFQTRLFLNTLFTGSEQTLVETARRSLREVDSGRETSNIGALWTVVTHTHGKEISPSGTLSIRQRQAPIVGGNSPKWSGKAWFSSAGLEAVYFLDLFTDREPLSHDSSSPFLPTWGQLKSERGPKGLCCPQGNSLPRGTRDQPLPLEPHQVRAPHLVEQDWGRTRALSLLSEWVGSGTVPASRAGEDLTQVIQAYRTGTGRVREVAVLRRDSQSCSGFQQANFWASGSAWVGDSQRAFCLPLCLPQHWVFIHTTPPTWTEDVWVSHPYQFCGFRQIPTGCSTS